MDPRGFDFAGYYTGGLMIRQGNASQLYNVAEQARIERQLFHRERVLINPHPPFEALLFAPLTRLPYVTSYILWGAINVLLWLLSQYLFWRDTPIPKNFIRFCLLPLLFFPLWFDLVIGQTSLLLLFLFSATYALLKAKQDFWAGIALGLGVSRFPIVLPFVLICVLRSRWKMTMGFATAASLLGFLSFLAVGTTGLRSYVNLLIDITHNPTNPAYIALRAWKQMPNLRGLFFAVLPQHPIAVQIVTLIASFALIGIVAWQWRQIDQRADGGSMELMFAAAVTISLVAAPHLYIYDLTLVLLPVLLVMNAPESRQHPIERKILIAIVAGLSILPLYLLLLHWHAMFVLAPILTAFSLAAISMASRAESRIA